MKTKRILLAVVCLLVILGGLNYLLQQSPMPIGTPGSTPAAGARTSDDFSAPVLF